MPTIAVVDPTGTAGWTNALITSNSVGVPTSEMYFLRGGGLQVVNSPVPASLQPATLFAPAFIFAPPVGTVSVITYGATGGLTLQFFGLDSFPLYPTDYYTQFSFLPGAILQTTYFVDGNGQTAGFVNGNALGNPTLYGNGVGGYP